MELKSQEIDPESLLLRFIAKNPIWDLFSENKRLTPSQICSLEKMADLALISALTPSQTKRLRYKMALLAKHDYRLHDAASKAAKIGKPIDTEANAFTCFIKKWIPCAQAVLRVIKRLQAAFNTYMNTHNHAWNQQKYDIVLDELRGALIQQGILPTQKLTEFGTESHMFGLLHALCKPEAYKDAQDRYRHMMVHLRQGLASQRADTAPFFTLVCRSRFTGVNLHTFGQSLVENMIAAGISTVTDRALPKLEWLEDLPLDKQLEAMTRSPRNLTTYLKVQLGKVKATINYLFDPHIQSNVCHRQLDFQITDRQGQTCQVIMIGMGTPTIENGRGRAEVNPEFTNFIQEHPGSHLYVNLQNNAPKWLIGDESARIDALTRCSQNSNGKLHLVTLAQDSDFYHQKKTFGKQTLTSKMFIRQFTRYMQTGQQGYQFPAALNPEFWSRLEVDLQTYCTALFDKDIDCELSVSERRDFLELSYPLIIDHLLQEFGIATMNITCKDGIDRGGKTQGLFIQYLAIGETEGFTPVRKKLMAAISLARAPLVKAQAMISSRRRRFLSALQQTEKNGCHARIQNQYWSTKKARPVITVPQHKESQIAISA